MKPVACTLTPNEMERRIAIGAELSERALIDSTRTPGGYALRFRESAEAELSELIAAESSCCSFMSFRIERQHGEIRVAVEAPEVGQPLIAELFGLAEGAAS